MFRSEASYVPKAYILGTRICADLSLRPTGEELKKILLLACCYQEAGIANTEVREMLNMTDNSGHPYPSAK
jgi:hypothetical protein